MSVQTLADEIAGAYALRRVIATPSSREADWTIAAGYAVLAELQHRRRASGRTTVGRKVGYANKAVWRALKMETLVWAPMYDDTVRAAAGNDAEMSLDRMIAPRIEPEIVFSLKTAVPAGLVDPVAALETVEWLALGFEIIDCPYADWTFQPADFVAASGLHAALVVGEPVAVTAGNRAAVAEALPAFTLQLVRNGQPVAQGSGRHSLRSPALCLAELASALARQSSAEPLAAGELISTGTLTDPQTLAAGETWTASVAGLDLPALTLHVRRPA